MIFPRRVFVKKIKDQIQHILYTFYGWHCQCNLLWLLYKRRLPVGAFFILRYYSASRTMFYYFLDDLHSLKAFCDGNLFKAEAHCKNKRLSSFLTHLGVIAFTSSCKVSNASCIAESLIS